MNSLAAQFESDVFWEACLGRLSREVSSNAMAAWFTPITPRGLDGDTLILLARNEIVRDFVALHYRALLEEVASAELGARVRVLIEIAPQGTDFSASEAGISALPAPAPVREAPAAPARRERAAARIDGESIRREASRLIPRMTFESFVEGDCNRLALAAARQVAEHPGTGRANPLVLIGGTGLGKTHLMHAVGNFCLANDTARKVVYRTSEEFSREFLEYVVVQKKLRTFHEIYRDADVLLIDDIQFFGGAVDKPVFRAEMVHILAMLQSQRKQVVLTCDRQPAEIRHFDRQILSRIETGLTVDLGTPDRETRLAILRQKAHEGGWMLTASVLEHIAQNVTGNVRELEGTLLRLCAYSDLCGGTVDLDTAQAILGDAVRAKDRSISLSAISEAFADSFGIGSSLLRSRTRRRHVAHARHLAMLLASELTDNTLHTIGLHFGRDYSTVAHSIKVAQQLLSESPDIASRFREIRARFDG